MEQIAKAIYDWCIENEMWLDVIVYFDGKAWSSHKKDGAVRKGAESVIACSSTRTRTRWTTSSMPTQPRFR